MHRPLALCLFLLVAAAAAATAEDWSDGEAACRRALGSHDAARWQAAHQHLKGRDHPAAIAYVLRFYKKQRTYEGAWKNAEGRNLEQMTGAALAAYYRSLLPDFESVRSVRYAFEQLDGPDADGADLLVSALKGRVTVHAIDEPLREAYAKALAAEDETRAARYRALLEDRLHVGDIAWVEDLPDPEALSTEARAVNAALDAAGPIPQAFAFAAWLARKDEAPAWEVVRDAYHARLAATLALPPLRGLPALHRAAVAIAHRRTLTHDEYFHGGKQRQWFDKKAVKARREDASLRIDFTNHPVAREIRLVRCMRAWLAERADGRRLLGTPYHADLFALNEGRVCDVDSIAFTHRDRRRKDLRDEVLRYNAKLRGVQRKERENAALVNAYRADHGLLPVRLDADLCVAARRHSAYQRSRGAIAHIFPDRREPHGVTPHDRVVGAGYPHRYATGENVYMGSSSAKEAHKAWRRSPAHKRNMLQPGWTELGVGVSGVFWTQNFANEPYDQDHDAE